ncbi:glycerol-3-phosphate acyltransferase PlsX [Caldalkalibacillus uzonensis]|uniref:Phosphate acyltransferase n=1 Tax=Caldalkalibacillus uzonensis TaxID=353224 RepID=A0ABU0CN09_9BACI|nr:phosphate acyltransferase PlsX [Caldalkalibacillus uzonensis]MDQ0337542.1 glycerol-3-phosphate acyltransferase PlsX [Caldalkalibacillus uzonensis]
MKIAIDIMGGDYAPDEIVKGALLALDAFDDIELVLVGRKEEITSRLGGWTDRIQLVHTDEVIAADEEPVRAVRRKKNASLVTCTRLVKEQKVHACISAGNTGAYMTAGLLVTGRIKGIERPALATVMPTSTGSPVLLLDVGANVEAKPAHLVQYAWMGHIYANRVLHIPEPRIGLLNVGTEETKGNELVKSAYGRLKNEPLNFIGNIEARDIPSGGADVVVCDGFTGNVVLKLTEGVAGSIFTMLKEVMTATPVQKIGALLLKPGLKGFKKKMDYTEYGGAPLLGLDGICIKAHGSSNANAVKNAIRQARECITQDVAGLIRHELGKVSETY